MTISSIRHNINKRGVIGCVLFYLSRLHTQICIQLMRLVIRIHSEPQETIVFRSSNLDFSDNAKALFDYLISHNYQEKYKIVWCVYDPQKYINYQSNKVRFVTTEGKNGWVSLRAVYYGATARFFFFTHDTAGINQVRCQGQTAINIGHGNGYKAPKKNIEKILNKSYKFDYLLVSGPAFIDVKAQYWNCEKEKILDIGFPRYDWFHKKTDKALILHQLFGIELNSDKVILWLPTFFNNHEIDFPENKLKLPLGFSGIQNRQELEQLDQCCKSYNVQLIIKQHPNQIDWIKNGISYSNIYFLNNEQLTLMDISLPELMSVTDALMTDFSSAAVDYLLLDRPIGFVLTDFERYAQTRGFIIDNPKDYMPGEHLYFLQDFIQFIKNISKDIDLYAEKRNVMRSIMHNETECYCERIINHFQI